MQGADQFAAPARAKIHANLEYWQGAGCCSEEDGADEDFEERNDDSDAVHADGTVRNV